MLRLPEASALAGLLCNLDQHLPGGRTASERCLRLTHALSTKGIFRMDGQLERARANAAVEVGHVLRSDDGVAEVVAAAAGVGLSKTKALCGRGSGTYEGKEYLMLRSLSFLGENGGIGPEASPRETIVP